MTVCVAFLRGINVGGRKLIGMADLRRLFAGLGFEDARTVLQSGNVVFDAGRARPAALAGRIEAAIAEGLSAEVTVILRTAAELADAMERNPFAAAAKNDPSHLLVVFLAGQPQRTGGLDAHEGPEATALSGREMYIHYREGIGRSKLTNAVIEKALGVAGTGRNWNTLARITDMITRA